MWGDSEGAEPASRGREHLDFYERSEIKSLVTGDRYLIQQPNSHLLKNPHVYEWVFNFLAFAVQ